MNDEFRRGRRTDRHSLRHRHRPHRTLRLESLERRSLLAVATDIEHDYREDDYSLGSKFNYALTGPDWTDTITNGSFSNSSGHVVWNSPSEGTATYAGVATGSGLARVLFGGSFHDCARYSIRDEGTFDLAIHAGSKTMSMRDADTISTSYTSYQDLTGGFCGADENPAQSIFFGGFRSRYAGVFDPTNHKASVTYVDNSSAYVVNVSTTPAVVDWSGSTTRDISITALPSPGSSLPIPENWYELQQSGSPDPSVFDIKSGAIAIQVSVAGDPFFAPVTGVDTPVGNLRLFWAATDGGTSLGSIPLSSSNGTAGIYWNSRTLSARLEQFPLPPAGAKYVAVAVDVPGVTESTLANNVDYVKFDSFEARDTVSGPIDVGSILDKTNSSLLDPLDAANPNIKVLAVNYYSTLGGTVSVDDDRGGFTYESPYTEEMDALAQGEVIEDSIQFRAIKDQTLVDDVVHTVKLSGINDYPYAEYDTEPDTPTGSVSLFSNLLDNDSDIDHGDRLHLSGVDPTSAYGATVTLVDGKTVKYDPTQSVQVRSLKTGEIIEDSFYYYVSDLAGAESGNYVVFNIVGQDDPPYLSPIADHIVRVTDPIYPIPFNVGDWEEPDPAAISVTSSVVRSTFNGSVQVTVNGDSTDREFQVTVPENQTGRVLIRAIAKDSNQLTSQYQFYFVVGSDTDFDLDGIADSQEDAVSVTGDANGDGVRDAEQVNVVALDAAQGSMTSTIVAPSSTALSQVEASNAPAPSGTASGAQFPLGIFAYQLQAATTGQTIDLRFQTSTESGLNSFYTYTSPTPGGESVPWNWMMYGRGNGAKAYADAIVFTVTDGGRGDQDGIANGIISGQVSLAHVNDPWHNRDSSLDIDNSGLVAPLDAIHIINHLNSFGSHNLPVNLSGQDAIALYIDTNSDNIIAPLDAINVINFLNHRPTGEGEVTMMLNSLSLRPIFVAPHADWPSAANSAMAISDSPASANPWGIQPASANAHDAVMTQLANSTSSALDESLDLLLGVLRPRRASSKRTANNHSP